MRFYVIEFSPQTHLFHKRHISDKIGYCLKYGGKKVVNFPCYIENMGHSVRIQLLKYKRDKSSHINFYGRPNFILQFQSEKSKSTEPKTFNKFIWLSFLDVINWSLIFTMVPSKPDQYSRKYSIFSSLKNVFNPDRFLHGFCTIYPQVPMI